MLASGFLTEEEAALLKRARNHRSMSRPQHADPKEYKLATGFEALLGYLYLKDERDILREIAAEAVRIVDAASRAHTVK
jgi:ribonuclease-3 family protein